MKEQTKPLKKRKFPVWLRILLQILVSGIIFYLISQKISLSKTLEFILGANLLFIVLGVITKFIAVYPTSSIWRRSLFFLSKHNQQISIKEKLKYLRIYVESYFFDNVGIGTLGSDFYRIANTSKDFGIASSTGSIFFEKFMGLMLLFWVVGASYIQQFVIKNQNYSILIILLTLGVFVVPWLVTGLLSVIDFIKCRFSTRFEKSKIRIIRELFNFNARPSYREIFDINLRVSFIYVCGALEILLISHAVGTNINITEGLFLFSGELLFSSIPISLQGIGVRDATIAGGLSLFGYNPETAVAISTIYLAQKVFLGVIGGILFLSKINTRQSPSD